MSKIEKPSSALSEFDPIADKYNEAQKRIKESPFLSKEYFEGKDFPEPQKTQNENVLPPKTQGKSIPSPRDIEPSDVNPSAQTMKKSPTVENNTPNVLLQIADAIKDLNMSAEADNINRFMGSVGVALTRGQWDPWSGMAPKTLAATIKTTSVVPLQTTSVIPAPATQTTSVIPAPMRIDPGDVTNPTDFEYMP